MAVVDTYRILMRLMLRLIFEIEIDVKIEFGANFMFGVIYKAVSDTCTCVLVVFSRYLFLMCLVYYCCRPWILFSFLLFFVCRSHRHGDGGCLCSCFSRLLCSFSHLVFYFSIFLDLVLVLICCFCRSHLQGDGGCFCSCFFFLVYFRACFYSSLIFVLCP